MREIIGEYLKEILDALGIAAVCTYQGGQGYWEHFEVWEISDPEYAKLCAVSDSDWEDNSTRSWWRSAEGSNLGDPDESFIINGQLLNAWRNETRVDDLIQEYDELDEDEMAAYDDGEDYLHYWLHHEYSDLLTYLCDELGASNESNVCALAVDLAKHNNISIAELFHTYGETTDV